MDETNSSVRNISDTARWVAYFRARETQPLEAWFRDPFAECLVLPSHSNVLLSSQDDSLKRS
jgi:hypothetical protein